MYPLQRNRRLRTTAAIRDLVREHHLSPHDFIVPLFVVEGKNKKEAIPSMPGYFRYSMDGIIKQIKTLWNLNIKAVLLFVKVEDAKKDNLGTEALRQEGLMQLTIGAIKEAVPEMVVMTDVALDPYYS